MKPLTLSVLVLATLVIVSFPSKSDCAPGKPVDAKSSSASKSRPRATTAKSAVTPASAALTQGYKSYADDLKGRIGNNWWNYPNGRNRVVLTVTINPDGSATDIELTSSPKNGEAEQAASDAFNKAQPFGALPSGSPACRLVATFDSTADQYTSKTNFQLRMDPLSAKPMATQEPTQDSSAN